MLTEKRPPRIKRKQCSRSYDSLCFINSHKQVRPGELEHGLVVLRPAAFEAI